MVTVNLVDMRDGAIHRYVDVEYSRWKGIRFSVHDIGEGASLNDDEYECWYTVRRGDVRAFCTLVGVDPSHPIAGLVERYSGDAFDELASMMSEAPMVEFASYW